MQKPAGLLFVFSGPSGAGKNTIMDAVMESESYLQQLPTATTRECRHDEKEGREHYFVTEAEFRQRILAKSLIEWQIIHAKGVYGVPRHAVQDVILGNKLAVADVDVLGAMDLKREFDDHVVLIYVLPPDKATLEKRLRDRPDVDTEEELQTRLRRADFEMGFADQYDHHIINRDNELDASVAQALNIIREAGAHRPYAAHNLGWNPDEITYQITGLVVQDGHLLQHNGTFPRLDVPAHKLPFEALHDYFQSHLDIDIVPTRPYAEERAVAIDFEPPQMVRVGHEAQAITRNHVYILKPATPITTLPDGWRLTPINYLHLDESTQKLLLQAMGNLQVD